MNRETSRELTDFLRFCESERRLAPMTCSAYKRDVSACLAYLQAEGIELADVKVTHLRAFLAEEQKCRPAVSSQARTTAGAQVLLPLPGRGGAAAARPGASAANAEEARDAARRADHGRARAAARPARSCGYLGASLRRQGGARPVAARADGLRWPATKRAARARLGRRRPLAAVAPCSSCEGRPATDDPDPPGARVALRRVLRRAPSADRAGAVCRRAGQPAPQHAARPGLPPLRRGEPASTSASASPRTRSGTCSPPSSSTQARTCVRSRSSSATSTSTRRSATRA